MDGPTDADQIIGLLREIRDLLKAPEKKRVKKEKPETVGLWQSYKDAYVNRYGVEPTRNARVNGILFQVYKRIPEDKHESLAKFYLTQTDALFLRSMHDVGLFLQNCEMLLTRMQSGVVVTMSKAMDAERVGNNVQASQNYLTRKRGP